MAKISVLLTDAEDTRFSAYCEEKGYKKSTLVARLIRDYLNKEGYGIQDKLFVDPPAPPPAVGMLSAKT
jgi:hypothetical protein